MAIFCRFCRFLEGFRNWKLKIRKARIKRNLSPTNKIRNYIIRCKRWFSSFLLQSEDVSSPICIPSGANMSEFVTCYHPNITELNSTRCVSAARDLDTLTEETANVSIISSAEQYFRAGVLKEKSDISQGLGLPDPTLAGCLAVCWLLLYLTLR